MNHDSTSVTAAPTQHAASEALQNPCSSAELLAGARRIAEMQVGYSEGKDQHRVLRVANPDEIQRIRRQAIPPESPQMIEQTIHEAEEILGYRMPMDHPRNFCFIPAPVTPLSRLGETLMSTYNAHAGSWMQSSGPSAVEDSLVRWLAAQIGMPADTGGCFVSGGSLANLTGLVLARDTKLDTERRQDGIAYVSEHTHSSVAKALRVMGLTRQQIQMVPVDASYALDPEQLQIMIVRDRERGLRPFLVCATCGTTNTGAIDPLRRIADICAQYDVWMHVDGAYGASVALSHSHKHLVSGLERADSLSLDAHKWLFQTYGCAIVLVRHRKLLLDSFANDAEYLRDAVTTDDEPNFWNYGLELTRPARAMKLWFTLRTLGSQQIGRMIDHGIALAEHAEVALRAHPEWVIVSPASLGIITFRYQPKRVVDQTRVDALHTSISQAALRENVGAILTTQIGGRKVLRIVAISPELSLDEMGRVISRLTEISRMVDEKDQF